MKINTASFGQLEIDPETIITFPSGLPGFDTYHRFKLFHSEEYTPLHCLQSVDDADVCFSLMEPLLFGHEYEMLLSDEDMALLQVEDDENLIVLLMVYHSVDDKPRRRATDIPMNTNWRSPIIINVKERIGLQKCLSQVRKTIRVVGS